MKASKLTLIHLRNRGRGTPLLQTSITCSENRCLAVCPELTNSDVCKVAFAPPVLSCAGYMVMHSIRKIVFQRGYFLKGLLNGNVIATSPLLKALFILLSIKAKNQLIFSLQTGRSSHFSIYWDSLSCMNYILQWTVPSVFKNAKSWLKTQCIRNALQNFRSGRNTYILWCCVVAWESKLRSWITSCPLECSYAQFLIGLIEIGFEIRINLN